MRHAARFTSACLLCTAVGFLGGMGCPAFEALLSGEPAGFPGGGVLLRIENQSGLLTNVSAVYHLGSEEVRRTERVLPPEGNESTTEVIRTHTDDIMVVATVAGAASVDGDVPPFCMAVGGRPTRLSGLNVVGLRRAGYDSEGRLALKKAYRTLFRTDRPRAECMAAVEGTTPEVERLLAFLKEPTKYGVVGFRSAPSDG